MGILGADGAFAEFVAVPVTNLHVVPASVSDEEAVLTEPLAAAFEILEQVQLNPGDEVLVLGDGKLSFLCAQVLRLASDNVALVGKHPDKLKLIKRSGVRTILLNDWKPKQFDLVVEATGSPSGLPLAMSAVRATPARSSSCTHRSSPRHPSAKDHRCRRAQSFACAAGDQRDHRRRFPLRPVRSCAGCVARRERFGYASD